MFSLRGNVYTPEFYHDIQTLKHVAKESNLAPKMKKKVENTISKIEKHEQREKTPALDLRAMYGN